MLPNHTKLIFADGSTAHLIWLDKCRIVSTDDVLGVRDFTADFYTLKEVSAMRNFATTREKCAFFWFFENFIDCVTGKLNNRDSKYLGTITAGNITTSDEAFALLLFENYVEKWHAQHRHNCTKTEMTAKMPRMHGKYTSKKVGQAEFGGWSREGVRKFNINCMQIMADRLSDKGQAAEQELLTYLQGTPKGQLVLQKHMRQQARRATVEANEEHEDAWNEMWCNKCIMHT